MKRINIAFLTLVIFALLTTFTLSISNWNIDPNYSIKFSGSKAEGTFSGLKGTIIFATSIPNLLAMDERTCSGFNNFSLTSTTDPLFMNKKSSVTQNVKQCSVYASNNDLSALEANLAADF